MVVPWVFDLVGMPGRSFRVGREGFIMLLLEVTVLTVFVRDGAFNEYGGRVVFVLIVSER